MSWVFTIVGIALLIVIHEGGHALAARWMGMKVERFSLFFPPILLKRKIGETEFALGSIPLGGYVRIAGQSPTDEVSPADIPRSYGSKPVWRRAVVIAAGPAANLLACLVLVTALLMVEGRQQVSSNVSPVGMIAPAKGNLLPGDKIISVDGKTGSPEVLVAATRAHRCAGRAISGCVAATPARVVITRNGATRTLLITPIDDPRVGAMRLGFSFDIARTPVGLVEAARTSVSASVKVTEATLRAITGVTDSAQRKQLGGIVGGVAVTEQAFSQNLATALELLAFISLSIAIVNLLPILPLDGGHLLWLLIEKLRGRPATQETLERAAMVGFALVAVLFVIGLSNDVGRLASGGFSQHP
jgi:regulator of sigma E protease